MVMPACHGDSPNRTACARSAGTHLERGCFFERTGNTPWLPMALTRWRCSVRLVIEPYPCSCCCTSTGTTVLAKRYRQSAMPNTAATPQLQWVLARQRAHCSDMAWRQATRQQHSTQLAWRRSADNPSKQRDTQLRYQRTRARFYQRFSQWRHLTRSCRSRFK